MADLIGKWAAGSSYGPVLAPVDLYLLKQPLALHPILKNDHPEFHLILNFATGERGGYNPKADERHDLPLDAHVDAPATLPRVQALHIVSRHSPWCTTVRNERGVTIGNVVDTLFREHAETVVSDFEWKSLGVRNQDAVKRAAQANLYASMAHHTQPAHADQRLRRCDWLRDRVFFDGMERNDDYALVKLGYKAPDVFVMSLTA